MKLNKVSIGLVVLIIGAVVGWSVLQRGKNQADQILSQCRSNTDQVGCIHRTIDGLESELSFEQMAKLIEELSLKPGGLQDCHELAHHVTGDYAKKLGPRLILESKIDSYSCGGGFLHGIIGVQMEQTNNLLSGDDGKNICDQYPDRYNQVNCVHMLGHIAEYVYRDTNRAVEVCQELADPDLSRHCDSGVFMEYTLGTVARSHSEKATVLQVNPDYLQRYESMCNEFDGIARDSCFTEAARIYISINQMDPVKSLAACQQVQPESASIACQKYAATLLAVNNPTNNKICEVSSTTLDRDECRDTIGYGLVSAAFSNISRIDEICSHDPSSQSKCERRIGKRIRETFGFWQSLAKCWQLENSDRFSCIRLVVGV